jgi:MFS family permease
MAPPYASCAAGFAIAAGPLVAGLLLEHHTWSARFMINVPVLVLAIVGALVLAPPSGAARHSRIDYAGRLLPVVWIGSLVYTLVEPPSSARCYPPRTHRRSAPRQPLGTWRSGGRVPVRRRDRLRGVRFAPPDRGG